MLYLVPDTLRRCVLLDVATHVVVAHLVSKVNTSKTLMLTEYEAVMDTITITNTIN